MNLDSVSSQEYHSSFLASTRRHVLMITNHGVHDWNIVLGVPDTGGQNIFVNQFADELVKHGFKITIVNRGGYLHPVTGVKQQGLKYKNADQRIIYIEDGLPEFVHKEDMHERIDFLGESLHAFMASEGLPVDLLISHYWDAAMIGIKYNAQLSTRVRHIWVPHSLGTLKKRNVQPSHWDDLRIEERIKAERSLIKKFDGVVSTSPTIKQTLEDDYGYTTPEIFLPPCVDAERFYPREVSDDNVVWQFLSQHSGLPVEQVRNSSIVTEISRTDTTKRKSILIEALAKLLPRKPNILLLVSIDNKQKELSLELNNLIRSNNLESHTAVVGSVWEILPILYSISDVYCTPSIMEGFGMSAQEAAASGIPVVASSLVPFAKEFLLGTQAEKIFYNESDDKYILLGEGAIIVQPDDVQGFAYALELLLSDTDLKNRMGKRAYDITIPYFTWDNKIVDFFQAIGEEFD